MQSNTVLKILTITISLCFSLILADITLRFLQTKTNPHYHVSDLNSFGNRDYYHIPKDSFKIVALGDSMTWGFGVNYTESFVRLIEGELNLTKQESEPDFELANLAYPGYATIQEVARFEEFLKNNPDYKPDLVLLVFYYNDVKNDHANATFQPIPGQKIVNWMQHHQNFSKLIQLTGKALNLHYFSGRSTLEKIRANFNPDFIGFQKAIKGLDRLYDLSDEHGFKVVIPILPTPFSDKGLSLQAMTEVENLIKKEATKRKFYPIPFLDLYAKYPKNDLAINPTDPHPSVLGNLLIADRIISYLGANELVPNQSLKSRNQEKIALKRNKIKLQPHSFSKGEIQNGIIHKLNRGGIISEEFIYTTDFSGEPLHFYFKTPTNESLTAYNKELYIYYPQQKQLDEDPIEQGKSKIKQSMLTVFSKEQTDLIYRVKQTKKSVSGAVEVNIFSYEQNSELLVSYSCSAQENWKNVIYYRHEDKSDWKRVSRRAKFKGCPKGSVYFRFRGSTPAGNDWLSIHNLAIKITYPEIKGEKKISHTMLMTQENIDFFRKNNASKVEMCQLVGCLE